MITSNLLSECEPDFSVAQVNEVVDISRLEITVGVFSSCITKIKEEWNIDSSSLGNVVALAVEHHSEADVIYALLGYKPQQGVYNFKGKLFSYKYPGLPEFFYHFKMEDGYV